MACCMKRRSAGRAACPDPHAPSTAPPAAGGHAVPVCCLREGMCGGGGGSVGPWQGAGGGGAWQPLRRAELVQPAGTAGPLLIIRRVAWLLCVQVCSQAGSPLVSRRRLPPPATLAADLPAAAAAAPVQQHLCCPWRAHPYPRPSPRPPLHAHTPPAPTRRPAASGSTAAWGWPTCAGSWPSWPPPPPSAATVGAARGGEPGGHGAAPQACSRGATPGPAVQLPRLARPRCRAAPRPTLPPPGPPLRSCCLCSRGAWGAGVAG